MEKIICCSGFYVIFAGDPSVGIFDNEWKIEGDFVFDNVNDFKTFKDKLIEAWEYVSDTPIGVESFEEREERLERENKLLFSLFDEHKFQSLIRCLCTEEMVENGTAKRVKARGKIGYLFSYDAGLGFGMYSDEDHEYELGSNEIEILD